jgi:hypothetical protein
MTEKQLTSLVINKVAT